MKGLGWLGAALFLKAAWACCSMAPAHFGDTRGLACETVMNGQVVHLLAYQNTAKNLAEGANAMLLPIPAVAKSMTSKNILDTSPYEHFLEDIQRSIRPPSRSKGGGQKSVGSQAEVFDHDIYTIVLAQDAKAIPSALGKVPERRRPKLHPRLFEAYGRWYPGWTFALCCFEGRDQQRSKPMLWWYQPRDPDHLFFPGLDAHDGNLPDLKAEVEVDHDLAVSSHLLKRGVRVVYRKPVPDFLPSTVLGASHTGQQLNGDFRWDVSEVRQGRDQYVRVSPPGV
jgi:hypothetical protein